MTTAPPAASAASTTPPPAAPSAPEAPEAPADVSRRRRRVLTASFIGTTVEYYDFYLYATASALVFGSQFFPNQTPAVGLLSSFAAYGVGFLARPIGGIVAGHLGDRIGRKRMLVYSLVLMGVASTLIGVLPTYATIGLASVVGLVFLRLVQGIAAGAEWGGSALLSVEHAPPTAAASSARSRRWDPRAACSSPPASSPPRASASARRRSSPGAGACRSSSARCSWASAS
ncbi:Inner membrane metabolite transport protein YhjE [Clavibacter michiganensis subsp. michiganensis]|uniref:Inner membrane metabolite transport protein YhjE n=1 Tax=Clavibacter michiganensis subsp. michiganensis TaxID=33013 RepID=A0A251XHI5_CLAMM|nr:Inner membrane metabolite transport protein YhjE [Clavibacter michiganensis subsp. michiganensis]OUE02479.1 Inner membrane metabolite transport protein YhjE [Clavibacter michiganensis subsp. michiganensis]